MRYVAAYLLAVLGGNSNPTANDIKQILSSVAVDVDENSLSKVIKELQGKDIKELMAEGHSKLASVPAAGAVAAPAAGGAAAAKEAPQEEKKEEKKEESEESDDDMGFGLFD